MGSPDMAGVPTGMTVYCVVGHVIMRKSFCNSVGQMQKRQNRSPGTSAMVTELFGVW